jgi:nucleotide-binding universal stress UspA family protein
VHVARDGGDGEAVLGEARRYLAAYDLQVTYRAVTGPPHERIVDVLRDGDFDLLFIGAYGHSRIIEMVLGSTTEYVLRNSPAPVFLTR